MKILEIGENGNLNRLQNVKNWQKVQNKERKN